MSRCILNFLKIPRFTNKIYEVEIFVLNSRVFSILDHLI